MDVVTTKMTWQRQNVFFTRIASVQCSIIFLRPGKNIGCNIFPLRPAANETGWYEAVAVAS